MIKILDTSTINKIAAGEVIERPFSVIKELVENSIDAGSTKIIVEIKEGGVAFIRVTDNGCGIPAGETELAFESHATSKINAIADLNTLNTLGFRGEALASIAAVSQLELTSKTEEQDAGVSIEVFGGEIIGKKETACNTGTVITMRSLFYNTPARRKFLKSASAETGYISDFISRIALSRPDISFRFINNGNETLYTSGSGDLKTAVFSVYGIDYTENLINVNYEKGGIAVNGFVGKPAISRSNRVAEDMFVNGRYVKDKIISRAAEDAYKTYLTINKFPAFILNISLSAKEVDVNAHPQKLEVRFADEEGVYGAVYNAVSGALKSVSLVQEAEWGRASGSRKRLESLREADKANYNSAAANNANNADFNETNDNSVEDRIVGDNKIVYSDADLKKFYTAREKDVYVIDRPIDYKTPARSFEKSVFEAVKAEQTAIPKEKLFQDYEIMGRIYSTFWLVMEDGGLYIIDQHAAHERIMFEEVKQRLRGANIVSQRLLSPEKLSLSDREKGLILENTDYFEGLGFELEYIDDEFYLHSCPMILSSLESSETIKQLLDMLMDKSINNPEDDIFDIKLNTLASIACKKAVKANDDISDEEARVIIEELLSLDNPFTCPHGRPTIVELKKKAVEQMFKRV